MTHTCPQVGSNSAMLLPVYIGFVLRSLGSPEADSGHIVASMVLAGPLQGKLNMEDEFDDVPGG